MWSVCILNPFSKTLCLQIFWEFDKISLSAFAAAHIRKGGIRQTYPVILQVQSWFCHRQFPCRHIPAVICHQQDSLRHFSVSTLSDNRQMYQVGIQVTSDKGQECARHQYGVRNVPDPITMPGISQTNNYGIKPRFESLSFHQRLFTLQGFF